EIKDVSARHAAIVQDFVKEPEKTLVIAPRNTDRQRINRQIHEELKHNRQIGDENKTIKVLEARNELSGAERKVAGKYQPGDIVQYSRGSREHGITGGSQTKVIKIDRENNLLTVQAIGTGKTATYDPKRLSGVSVFKEEEIEVCAGERLQARAAINPGKGRGAAKIANGEMLTIERIKGDKIHLLTQTGKAFLIDAKEAVALDYGYAATSHSAQGKTIDRVLIHADTEESEKLLNERMAYVAVSRARDEIKIYTDDAAKLPGKLARKTQKTEIADVLQNFEQQKAEETTVPPDVKAENMPVKTVFSGKTEILTGRANGDSNEPLFANLTDDLPAPDARKPTTENPNQTADAQPEQKTAEQQPAQPEANQPTAKLSNSDYAVLNAQIIVRQAELSDLKFDEALFERDTEIKRFDAFIEPAKGREVSTAAAAKTIDRIEFLRLRSTGESVVPPPGDEANWAKWSMTDVNAAREVLTETRDFIKAEKNSRDENKWHSQQNLKNLFENHLNPLKMAE
ncbi:MAG TPA: hypothetical protein VNI84_01060, partial [Pyrinomonadaceae bacterium]|nr:hypothetical protein [Pyrinomonadaceae bacterium]